MKILHYSLGFSPYRSGGMTRYVEDLMEVQKKDHEVGLLWPGKIQILGRKITIKKHKKVSGIDSYELMNPLPVPLLEGVRDIPAYMGKGDLDYFLRFLQEEKPDVIHIHTFMGLYAEFIEAAKQLNIRTVFTTHDYYAICPKVNMLCKGKVCETGMGDAFCSKCDMNPLSSKKIMILQSPLYRYFKESAFVKALRKKWAKNKQDQKAEAVCETAEKSANTVLPYNELKQYYGKMLSGLSVIHSNSTLAGGIYQKFGEVSDIVPVTISNQNIVDKRVKKVYNEGDVIRILYLGPVSEYKGYFILIQALDVLYEKYGNAFELHVYSPVLEKRDYIIEHESFKDEGLDNVLGKTELLAAPSVWKETFGFVALEALSRGVPVLVTENVGAKDLVVHGKNGFVIEPNAKALTEALEQVIKNPQILAGMNEYILKMDFPYTMQAHADEMVEKIYSKD